MKFIDLKIDSYSFPIANALKVNLLITNDLKEIFKFKCGQFITVNLTINGKEFRRDYSICSVPNENTISILVKKVDDGTVSTFLNEQIHSLETLSVSTPTGSFGIPEKPNEKRTLIFFASGSGITPIISIIKYTLANEKGVTINLFYGNKDQENTLFFEEINELKNSFPENFNPYFIYSNQKTEPIFQGRLDAQKLNLFINQLLDWDEVDEVLICGPEEMIRALARASFSLGILKKNIHFELFTIPKESIYEIEQTENVQIDKVEVDFVYEGEKNSIIWETKETSLLDAMLDAGFDVPYSCKGGVCSSCMCKIKEGDISVDENLILTDTDLENNLRIVCVAIPKTAKISLDFDDLN